jgi:hypothetical protein
LGNRVHGNSALFPLLAKEANDIGTDGVTQLVFWHALLIRGFKVDKRYDYSHFIGMFIRRLGPNPHANGRKTPGAYGCPDILELEDGDFAVIGADITDVAVGQLAFGANCGPDERIVRVPRRILVGAKSDIPNKI